MDRVKQVFTRIGAVGSGRESPRLSDLLPFKSPSPSPAAQDEDLLEHLPKTREWLESLPLHLIEEQEQSNAEKAAEALRLTHKLESHITSQESPLQDLTHHLSHLHTLTSSLSAAEAQASSLHASLLDLTHHVHSLERHLAAQHAASIRARERDRFAAYRAARRRSVEALRDEYAGKLDEFRRERLEVLGGIVRPGSAGVGRRRGAGRAGRKAGVGLEEVTIEDKGLDGFFDDDDDDDDNAAVSQQHPPQTLSSSVPTPRSIPLPQPASSTLNPKPKAQQQQKQKQQQQPEAAKPAAKRRDLILADEDLDDDLEELYKPSSSSKKKKGKGNVGKG